MRKALKRHKLRQKDIAKMFGYASIASFHNSTAKERLLDGVEALIILIENRILSSQEERK